MSSIMIRDLAQTRDLDRKAMSAVRGGNSWLQGLGPVANVNVAISQNIFQVQDIEVLNHSVIGPGVGPLRLNVSPKQFASTGVNL